MPFNASGTYTLSDDIANATSADATEVQGILDDIETALNLTFLRSGSATATGQFLGIVGATSQYSFSGDTNTGVGSDTGDEVWLMGGGVKTLKANATGVVITGTLAPTGLSTFSTLAVTSTRTFSDTITSTSASAGFVGHEAICTEAGAAAGPIASLYRNSASPAASDVIGAVNFYGKDSASNKTLYGQVTYAITDTTDGSEDADWYALAMVAGTLTTVIKSSGSGIAIPGALAVTGAITAASETVTGALSGGTAAGGMLASQSDQETATATNKLVAPGTQHFHPGHPKAWANFDQSGTHDIARAYNVTSITDAGVGQSQLNFAITFSDTTFGWSGSARDNDASGDAILAAKSNGSKTATVLQVIVVDSNSNAFDSGELTVIAWGDI